MSTDPLLAPRSSVSRVVHRGSHELWAQWLGKVRGIFLGSEPVPQTKLLSAVDFVMPYLSPYDQDRLRLTSRHISTEDDWVARLRDAESTFYARRLSLFQMFLLG